jgi:uncharacterized protein DUF6882
MHDSSTCKTCHGLPVGDSLSDAEFSQFLAACRIELATKQETFRQRLEAGSRWFYDLADLTLRIGNLMFDITPIGTYSSSHSSWLWAWANDDFPSSAREASLRVQALHDMTGFRVFSQPGTGASPEDANDFVALAVHALGAQGFYRCPSDGPTLYLAVDDDVRRADG